MIIGDVAAPSSSSLPAIESSEQTVHEDVHEFFQYLREQERIKQWGDHPLCGEISEYITEGNWDGLVDCYNRNYGRFPFYDILDATFLVGKNRQIDGLVTAYMVIANSACWGGCGCGVISYREAIDSGEWKDLDTRLADIGDVPENQRYLFKVHTGRMNPSQIRLLKAFFSHTNRSNYVIGGFCHKEKEEFLVASAALMRKDSRLSGFLRFVYNMPRRSTVCEYLQKREHVISLFHPKDEEKILIHGQHPTGVLSLLHDGFHADVRSSAGLLEKQKLLEVGLAIGRLLGTLPKYSDKNAVLSEGVVYRKLNADATQQDLARFCLEELLQHIIDGENMGRFLTEKNIEEILSAIMGNDYSRFSPMIECLRPHFASLGYSLGSQGYAFMVTSK